MSTSINQVLSDLKKKLNEINAMKNKIYIVNAGITNNGKSSTFNSLLRLKGKLKPDASDEMAFKVKDVRTTIRTRKSNIAQVCICLILQDLKQKIRMKKSRLMPIRRPL